MARLIRKQPWEQTPINFDFSSKYGSHNAARMVELRRALEQVKTAGSLVAAQGIATVALNRDNAALGRVITGIDVFAVTPTGDAEDLEFGQVHEQTYDGLIAQHWIRKGRSGVTYKVSCRVTLSDGSRPGAGWSRAGRGLSDGLSPPEQRQHSVLRSVTGTGNITIGSAVDNFAQPPGGLDGFQVGYRLFTTDPAAKQWENGIGLLSGGAIARTAANVSNGTNGPGVLVNFTDPGTRQCMIVIGAEALALMRGGGVTVNEAASAATYAFVPGGQYPVSARRSEAGQHRDPRPNDLALTLPMYVVLPDPQSGPYGHCITIEKGDTSGNQVVIVGLATAVAVSAATNDFLTFVGYNPVDGDAIVLRRGTAPTPLALGTVYFARDSTGLTCKLALAPGGAVIDITATGAGFVAFRSKKTLTTQDQFQMVRIVGSGATTTWKWKLAHGGQQGLSSTGQNVLRAATIPLAQTALNLLVGTNVQAFHANLAALSAQTISAFALTLLDDANEAAVRTTLQLGALAIKNQADTPDLVQEGYFPITNASGALTLNFTTHKRFIRFTAEITSPLTVTLPTTGLTIGEWRAFFRTGGGAFSIILTPVAGNVFELRGKRELVFLVGTVLPGKSSMSTETGRSRTSPVRRSPTRSTAMRAPGSSSAAPATSRSSCRRTCRPRPRRTSI